MQGKSKLVVGLFVTLLIAVLTVTCLAYIYSSGEGIAPDAFTDETYTITTIQSKSNVMLFHDSDLREYAKFTIPKGTVVKFNRVIEQNKILIEYNSTNYFSQKEHFRVNRVSKLSVLERIPLTFQRAGQNISFTMQSFKEKGLGLSELFMIPMESGFMSVGFFIIIGLLLTLYTVINFFFLHDTEYLGSDFIRLERIWVHWYAKALPIAIIVLGLAGAMKWVDLSMVSDERMGQLLITLVPPFETVFLQEWIIWSMSKGIIVVWLIDYLRLVFEMKNNPFKSLLYMGIAAISSGIMLMTFFYLSIVAVFAIALLIGLALFGGIVSSHTKVEYRRVTS